MKRLYILILAIIVVATALPEFAPQNGLGGGPRMRRSGMDGRHRFGRDNDHMLEVQAANSYEDEQEQMRGLREVMEEDVEVLPDFEKTGGRNHRIKDLGITFDE